MSEGKSQETFIFICPYCNAALRAREQDRGEVGNCPRCGKEVVIGEDKVSNAGEEETQPITPEIVDSPIDYEDWGKESTDKIDDGQQWSYEEPLQSHMFYGRQTPEAKYLKGLLWLVAEYYRRRAIAGIVIGLGCLFFFNVILPYSPSTEGIATFFSVVGTGIYIWGLYNFAKSKGYHGAWCLLGLLSILGLIILACMPDRLKEFSQYIE